jgi:hypothetical protein
MGLHDSFLQNVIGVETTKKTWNCLLKRDEAKGLTNTMFLKTLILCLQNEFY